VCVVCAQAGAGSGKKVTTSLLTSGLIVGAHASTRSPSWRSKYVQTLIHGENVVYCVALQHVITGRIALQHFIPGNSMFSHKCDKASSFACLSICRGQR
jgi:hypothetical protein